MNNDFYNPNGKVFEINDRCPICDILYGSGAIVVALFVYIQDFVPHYKTMNDVNLIVLVILLLFLSAGGFLVYMGWIGRKRNTRYIINSKDNSFFIPLKDDVYCRLSDIEAVNRRQESRKVSQSYMENGKARKRTVTEHSYYVQIVGENISKDFCFDSQGKRDEVYSSLNIGIKDVNDFLKKQA